MSTPPSAPERADPLEKADYELLAEFRHVLRRFLSFSEDAAAVAGLTAQQHQALLAIKGYPGRDHVTVGELAERLCVRPHSAVGLIDRLEGNGWVRRAPGPEDRRQVVISLTPAAEDLLAGLSRVHRDEIRRLSPLLRTLFDRLEG
ncbi:MULTISPECIES: MarR family winged helix-turn-helix transcriptional regulator [Nitrospirillum]|uniref:MarR family protein n=1 Tax=Nitrospirillum amazonense TaxID=28077 RepID=A0A560FC22_9PROT|nr:MarR family transcriptional regulator [Nitrospirillum amazonense]MEC4590007.1 MarR family transcriptional regulator [Nitrospirillum amazonense]TWB19161.1 MarR family protein [Nitrospirillum amazonense]